MAAQNIRVTKLFSFDMAHALYAHDGPCKNIHGHTYELRITLLGKVKNDAGHPKDGMIIDFSDLKKLVQKEIISNYDHALILNGNSPHAYLEDLKRNFEKIIYSKTQPTCENMLVDMVDTLRRVLPTEVQLHQVRLQETPTSYAEWFLSDNGF